MKLDLSDPIHSALLSITMAAVEEGGGFDADTVFLILSSAGLGDVHQLASDLVRDEQAEDEEALDDPEPEEEE